MAENDSEQRPKPTIDMFRGLPGNLGNPLVEGVERGQLDTRALVWAAEGLLAQTVQAFGGVYTNQPGVLGRRLPPEQAAAVGALLDGLEVVVGLVGSVASGELQLKPPDQGSTT